MPSALVNSFARALLAIRWFPRRVLLVVLTQPPQDLLRKKIIARGFARRRLETGLNCPRARRNQTRCRNSPWRRFAGSKIPRSRCRGQSCSPSSRRGRSRSRRGNRRSEGRARKKNCRLDPHRLLHPVFHHRGLGVDHGSLESLLILRVALPPNPSPAPHSAPRAHNICARL